MAGIPDSINIFKKIKQHFIMKKIEKNQANSKKNIGIIIINIIMVIVILAAYYFIFFINKILALKIAAAVLAAIYLIFIIVKLISLSEPRQSIPVGITKLILVDDSDNYKKEWNLQGKVSVLIGKSTRSTPVDIDLSDTENASMISRMHAVLNFASNNWYVEDIGSANGVGIKKVNDSKKRRVSTEQACKLELGDIIYIANTKLIVK